MRSLILGGGLVLSLLFNSYCQANGKAASRWQGVYEFYDTGGTEGGGNTLSFDITLKVLPNGTCEITREGYQVIDKLICSISMNENSIQILFKSFSDGKIRNKYGNIVYKPGERLFSLEKDPKREELVTDWGGLKPEGYVIRNRGIYFKRMQ